MSSLVDEFPFEEYKQCLERWTTYEMPEIAPLDPSNLLGYLAKIRAVIEEAEGTKAA